jgi:hypothetical protein
MNSRAIERRNGRGTGLVRTDLSDTGTWPDRGGSAVSTYARVGFAAQNDSSVSKPGTFKNGGASLRVPLQSRRLVSLF